MAKILMQEESPKWVKLMQYFEDHGGRSGKGCRVGVEELKKVVGAHDRTIHEYVKKMEEHGIIKIRRTTIDGSFGSPRGFNIYHLTCTTKQWETKVGPPIIEAVRLRSYKKRSALSRNRHAERKRKRLQEEAEQIGMVLPPARLGPRRGSGPIGPLPEKYRPPAPIKLPDEEVELLATAFDGLDLGDLAGW